MKELTDRENRGSNTHSLNCQGKSKPNHEKRLPTGI